MIFDENCYYHLFNRGCNKENIFIDDLDYKMLMEIIKESKINEYLNLVSYSLMPNHYHFLVRQKTSKPVTKWIQFIFNKYVKYFNKKYDRKGTLFESKVKAKLIDNIDYVGNIAHYIHNNPKTEYQKQYCSISVLVAESDNYDDFYKEFFGNIEEYLNSFEDYKASKLEEEIEKYLF